MAIIPKSEFPFLLKQVIPALEQFFYVGDRNLLRGRCITFVGTRDITKYGQTVISCLLDKSLAQTDIVIVSGLARGVDAYVHKVCLERSIKAVAIVPGGIGSAIPKSNSRIFEQLKKKGLILAEYPEEIVLQKEMFVLRNRLLAGISEATVVIEAGLKSGSLITANMALDYNRDVYVIPGNIDSEVSKGCNLLAKEGAGIITDFSDFMEILGIVNEQISLRDSCSRKMNKFDNHSVINVF